MTDPRKVTEKALQDAIAELAQTLGYMVFHARPAMKKDGTWYTAVSYDGKGFFDLVIAGHGTVMFVEVKSDHGLLTTEQRDWAQAMMPAATTLVWRPRQWKSGVIEAFLKGEME